MSLRGCWRALWLAASLSGFALSAAMTLSGAVFDAVATTVRAATGLATLAAAAPTVPYRGAARPLREAVEDTTRRVSARVAWGAARSVGTAAGEAIPFAGVAVVAAVTALDLSDACATLQDLAELAAALDPAKPLATGTVCGLKPPTVDDLVREAQGALDRARVWLGGGPPAPEGGP